MILEHHVSARRPKALALVGAVWVVLWALWLLLDASPLILASIGLFTLPAIFEAARGDTFHFALTNERMTWSSKRHSGDAPLVDIDYVRFDTRIDLAINARLYLVNGASLRLPIECVPPYPEFTAALDKLGIRHERHHFSVF